MTATMVTAASGSSETANNTSGASTNASASSVASSASAAGGNAVSGSASSQETTKQSSSEETKKSSDLQSSITETAAPSASDISISDAKGLSLSTEAQTEDGSGEKGSLSTAGTIFGTAAAVTISGLILMGAAAGILYLFRKNWYRWGGGEDDDAYLQKGVILTLSDRCSSGTSGETDAIKAAKQKVQALGKEPKLIATSPAVAAICDRLELDLMGVCSTSVSTIPERYEDLPEIGTAMSPDMEVIASLNPD